MIGPIARSPMAARRRWHHPTGPTIITVADHRRDDDDTPGPACRCDSDSMSGGCSLATAGFDSPIMMELQRTRITGTSSRRLRASKVTDGARTRHPMMIAVTRTCQTNTYGACV